MRFINIRANAVVNLFHLAINDTCPLPLGAKVLVSYSDSVTSQTSVVRSYISSLYG